MTEDDPGLVIFRRLVPKLHAVNAEFLSGLSVLEYGQFDSWCRSNLNTKIHDLVDIIAHDD